MPTTHTVVSTTQTVRSGFLDPTAMPVAVIAPGDTVRYPDTWTHWGNEAKLGMTFADREPLRHRYPHGPYSMLGPVEVVGAEPGDVLEVSITALRTIGWGWNSFPLGVGALPHDFAEPYVHYFTFDEARTTAEYVDGITLPMAPFLGVVAAEPAGDEQVSAIVSGPYGGNLVLRDLGVGSHLFLPVQKSGGRVWIGDVHALQGDGVVDQTAIETAAEDLEIRHSLHEDVALRGPLGETATAWIVIGFATSLDDALVGCLRETIHWLAAAAQITESEAHPQGRLPARAPRPHRLLAASGASDLMTLSVADRLDILDLITRADDAATRRDADGYAALFTADAVLDGAQGTHPAAGLRDAVRPIWAAEGPATLHLTLNPVIGPGRSADEAVVTSILLIVDPAGCPAIRTTAAITQTVRRTGSTWRIARRTVAAASVCSGMAVETQDNRPSSD